jgi:N-acetylmuramoyl-L-alanine amidase
MNSGVIMVKRTFRLLNAEFAEPAERVLLCGLCVLCVLYSSTAFALLPVRTMYNHALAREQSVRAALAAPDATPAVLADVHAVITAYEAVVAHYPASSYSDNALWQAGRLALDAFVQFGQQADKDAALRILRRLVSAYPASRLVKQVPDQLARIESPAPATSAAVPPLVLGPSKEERATPADAPLVPSPSAPDPSSTSGSSRAPSRDDKPRGDRATVEPSKPERQSARSTLATIKDIRRAVLPDAVRITIELDNEVPFQEQRIPDPARVFVDLPGTRAVPALVDRTLRFDGDADLVRQVRIGRHPNNTTRVVLDAAGVSSYSVYALYGPYRLVIDCVRTPVAAVEKPAAPRREPALVPLAARRQLAAWQRKLPTMSPRATASLADASAAAEPEPTLKIADPAPIPPLPATTAPPPGRQNAEGASTPPARNLTGGLSIARQLGLGVSRIVIDAGHGGHDPGAQGKGITESELVLDVALRLEKLLQKVPGVEVILTRRTDEFIPLPERTAIANREGADLFLSIHANASTSAQARGIETYFLNFANNLSAAAVAARENAASGQVMGALPDIVKAIALNNKLDESRDFAMQVQRAMLERLKTTNKTIKDLGVKQAPFVVLIGAAMPSVLAEISFVTNPQEAKLLKGSVYRQRIAESLLNAIRKYQTSLKNAPSVALQ